ncbi:hypothetical protein CAPN001_05710 [Capnocytophaga stomatis]|nr:hypothetical protein CAPN002_09780 [Capnocytophaga stomatis]GIJ96002.1 hypothetical protein CAPN001_05710 [Capnocytophaga stomatis]
MYSALSTSYNLPKTPKNSKKTICFNNTEKDDEIHRLSFMYNYEATQKYLIHIISNNEKYSIGYRDKFNRMGIS